MTDEPIPVIAGPPAPWWAHMIPDGRACVAVAVFLLTWRVIDKVAASPALGDNKLYFAIAMNLIGLTGLIVGFHFGASKGGAAVLEKK